MINFASAERHWSFPIKPSVSLYHKRTNKMFKFPTQLGPAEDWPEGSQEWALRIANRLNYTIPFDGDATRAFIEANPHIFEAGHAANAAE